VLKYSRKENYMNKVDLNQVLDLLISEDREQASKMLHNWFVDMSKGIHESMMQEEDEVLEDERLQDIEDDKDDIESEEFYGESDLGDEEGADEGAGEETADADAAADLGGEMGVDAEPETVEDRVEDLEATLAGLKAQFAELMGGAEDAPEGDAGEAEGSTEGEGEELATEESLAFESKDEDEDDKEEVDESLFDESDFADLEESFELEPVKNPSMMGGQEIGSDGKKIAVNDVSPLPSKKGPDRVGGKPVEIKAKEHKGYERETAPGVKQMPLLKNQVKTADANLTPVSKEGDKSAMLNKKDGFGSDSPKSPIGAGATDLRGSDFKRK
jgi:hypothetical protein